jgi:predicted DNA-binding helix-hairpin-helix protein
MQSVFKILHARKFRNLDWSHLKAIGIAINRAQYFITCNSKDYYKKDLDPHTLKTKILKNSNSKYKKYFNQQLSLFS